MRQKAGRSRREMIYPPGNVHISPCPVPFPALLSLSLFGGIWIRSLRFGWTIWGTAKAQIVEFLQLFFCWGRTTNIRETHPHHQYGGKYTVRPIYSMGSFAFSPQVPKAESLNFDEKAICGFLPFCFKSRNSTSFCWGGGRLTPFYGCNIFQHMS